MVSKNKQMHFIFGGVLGAIYATLYYFAANSIEPTGVLFVDGINTFLALSVGDIMGLKNGLITFPLSFGLGLIEWFVIGAYVVPGIGRLVVRLSSRKNESAPKQFNLKG